jgi:hypothetical protein
MPGDVHDSDLSRDLINDSTLDQCLNHDFL